LASPLSQILQTVQGGMTTDHLYGLERLASESSGTRTWYGSDGLGSVRQTINSSGTVLGSLNYDPWGTVESGTTPGFGFTGEMQDSVGMVYLRARWYNPANGTFTGYCWQTQIRAIFAPQVSAVQGVERLYTPTLACLRAL
jgi:hypothetical protein